MNINEILFLFTVLFLNSMIIFGLNYSFSFTKFPGVIKDKQALWFIGYLSQKYLGDFWSKPFTECIICMSSAWGLPLLIYFFPLSIYGWAYFNFDFCSIRFPVIHNLFIFLLYVPALAGINRFLIRFI